jgi:hypothetical protein
MARNAWRSLSFSSPSSLLDGRVQTIEMLLRCCYSMAHAKARKQRFKCGRTKGLMSMSLYCLVFRNTATDRKGQLKTNQRIIN